VPGIERVNPSPLTVSHDEDEVVVVVGVAADVYDGEAPGVVSLITWEGWLEVRLDSMTTATMPAIKTNSPPTIQGSGLRFFCS
jgi:hypothetical protein